jgi:hypothetical protein
VSVGSGFIVTPERTSTQIDILIVDDSAPLLFRDGDFMISTADAVRAVIEVKTSVPRSKLRDTIYNLDQVSLLLRTRCVHPRPFLGLFAFDSTDSSPEEILQTLKEVNGHIGHYEISALCFGDQEFYEFWTFEPGTRCGKVHDRWYAYDLPHLAPGYFIHSILQHMYPAAVERAEGMWFPTEDKEARCVAQITRRDLPGAAVQGPIRCPGATQSSSKPHSPDQG